MIFRPGRGMNYFMVLLACIVAILIVLIRIFLRFNLLEGLLI